MKTASEAIEAASQLRHNMDFSSRSRWRFRAVMDGGATAIRALVGDVLDDEEVSEEDLPWANWMYSALTKLAQKIGEYAKVRTDPTSDDQAKRDRADIKREAVYGYDDLDRLEMQLPQLARWIPGYGYGVWTIGARTNPEGVPYPRASLRDPFDCYPGEWGVDQQPRELAIERIMPLNKAKTLYSDYEDKLSKVAVSAYQRGWGGAVLMNGSPWENQRGRGLSIVEYYDEEGCHILIPAIEAKVDYIPNPLDSGPMFVVPKRFAFNALVGQYDHAFGLMIAGAKINALAVIGMEDAVFTETNVAGQVAGGKRYRIGRGEINLLTPGTQVTKPQSNLPYQMFEMINRIERQFRNVASYPVQDDAQSPLNFATGAGLNELLSAVSLEVREYQKVMRYGMQDIDSKRLEWDEKVSPNRRKTIGGRMSTIPGIKTYVPATDFKGDWKTKRNHGVMSGWDDATKIVGAIQLLEAEVLDALTIQENLDGIDDVNEVNERIQDRKARDSLMAGLVNATQSPDPGEKLRAINALIEMLPESDLKEVLKKFYTPEEPQMTPEQQAFIGQGGNPQDPMAQLFAGGTPNPATVLSRLTPQGGQGGVQTVGTIR